MHTIHIFYFLVFLQYFHVWYDNNFKLCINVNQCSGSCFITMIHCCQLCCEAAWKYTVSSSNPQSNCQSTSPSWHHHVTYCIKKSGSQHVARLGKLLTAVNELNAVYCRCDMVLSNTEKRLRNKSSKFFLANYL